MYGLPLLVIVLAGNLETDARIVEVTERGFLLGVGSEKFAVEDDSRTRFWFAKKPSERGVFSAGSTVRVKIKTDSTPALLREMADLETGKWLEKIRKGVTSGVVKKIEIKRLHVTLGDNSEFSYSVSEKTKFLSNGEPSNFLDLKEGAHVYIKAQLQSNQDTKAVEVNNRLIVAKTSTKTPKKAVVKPIKIEPAGKITGRVQLPRIDFGMFDIDYKGTLIHITFTNRTVIMLMGKPTTSRSIVPDQMATVTYQRDKFGRLIASKVDLIGGNLKG